MYNEKEVLNRISIAVSSKGVTKKEALTQCKINTSFLTDWEKGRIKSPGIDKIVALADYFNMSLDYLVLGIDNLPPILRGDEKRLLRLYNELNDNGRRLSMVNMYKAMRRNKEDREWWETHQDAVERLLLECFGSKQSSPKPVPTATSSITDEWDFEEDDFERDDSPFPVMKSVAIYYDQPASAGTGTFLDSNDYELMDFPIDRIPIQTTFGVRISGDSMTPDYGDEDIVFVKQQPNVEHGELAIFILNGDAYFKRLLKRGKTTYLESLNKNYKPILVKPSDELRVVGRVIGKYN